MQRTRWFAGVYILSFAGSLLLALGINVLGNTTGRFPSSLFPATSERAWKTRRLDEAVREGHPPEVVIFGSSRAMQIQPRYVQAITGMTVFNYAVSNGTPTEGLIQLRYLLKIGCRPKVIILGVDENLFVNDQLVDLRLVRDDLLGHTGLFAEVPFFEKLRILSSSFRRCDLSTTKKSLGRLARLVPWVDDVLGLLGRRTTVSNQHKLPGQMFLEDGYVVHCCSEDNNAKAARDLAVAIQKCIKKFCVPVRMAIQNPDAKSQRDFEEMLSLARANGIQVRAIVTPYHPDFERDVFDEKTWTGRRRLKDYLGTTCERLGALLTDLTDVRSFEGDPWEFLDSHHQRPRNLQRMINVAFGLPANSVATLVPSDREIAANPPPFNSATRN
jgi:hypothetical protein